MSRVSPVPVSAATDKVAQTYERIAEMLEGAPFPEPILLYGRVPAFLQDFYMNFKKFVWTDGHLDVQAKATLGLAVAAAMKAGAWVDFFTARCAKLGLTEQYVADVLAVVASCQMYNVFFKFRDLSGSELFSGMGVGLRAHTFANTSLDAKQVELINIVISDLNGCKPCTAGHIEKIRQLGVSDDAILESIQCGATMAAGCSFLNSATA
ncbi:MAG: carboxymuconolactone decarboxylase family protein [Planctomycetes bacterium]|nr:carboxymuconolactone decarboxylase family protein [Planctomycetota bacterium]